MSRASGIIYPADYIYALQSRGNVKPRRAILNTPGGGGDNRAGENLDSIGRAARYKARFSTSFAHRYSLSFEFTANAIIAIKEAGHTGARRKR